MTRIPMVLLRSGDVLSGNMLSCDLLLALLLLCNVVKPDNRMQTVCLQELRSHY